MKTARDLVTANNGKPRQANLRRAVSTAYYALFHCLARCCADLMIGTGSAARSEAAWRQVYRALDHGSAKNACTNQTIMKRFPKGIEDFGNKFVELQIKRHDADYSLGNRYYKSSVLQDIADAETVIDIFLKETTKDRRAFAALVLFKLRP